MRENVIMASRSMHAPSCIIKQTSKRFRPVASRSIVRQLSKYFRSLCYTMLVYPATVLCCAVLAGPVNCAVLCYARKKLKILFRIVLNKTPPIKWRSFPPWPRPAEMVVLPKTHIYLIKFLTLPKPKQTNNGKND